LRAPPPKVARLSRVAIAGLASLGAAGVGAAIALALQPHKPKPTVLKAETGDGRPPQAIVTGPRTYAEVPKLGPPLPGDLGRPILAAQARGQDVPTPPIGQPAQDPKAQAQAQALEAARTSAVFNRTNNTAPSPSIAAPLPAPTPTVTLSEAPSTMATTDTGRAFLDRNSPPSISAHRPAPPAARHILLAQTVIPAALISAVSSDLPGPVSAQVTRNVHDSLTGRVILIPQGARLIGRYDSQVAFGQRRVLLAWDRVIFPDGHSLQLDRLVAADSQGRSGLADRTNAHWGAMAKAALLSSVLGVGAALGPDDSDVARALRQGVQDTVNQTGQQVVRKQLDVQPTLTLRPGLPLTILVTRDIVFDD
jgi:type IV secretion system protein VirB10